MAFGKDANTFSMKLSFVGGQGFGKYRVSEFEAQHACAKSAKSSTRDGNGPAVPSLGRHVNRKK